ncbi:hypothetical protein MNBD_ALPHA03-2164, partial [hydrothermal vent metagenome]
LHHMMYDEANLVFGMAAEADPNCAIAYWGQSMTIIHPLWPDQPSSSELDRGARLVEKALLIGGNSPRESAYLGTTHAYFQDAVSYSEPQRLQKFEAAWKDLSDAYPDDLEARAFYALIHISTADSSDTTYRQQRKSGQITDKILRKSPNHPGAHHYSIHANDWPGLAENALKVADHYGEIAPNVPHAAHMMTHIYTRLGLWNKAIKWNKISADSAWAICVSTGEINVHYTHALDYLAYAHLQLGNDSDVLEIIQTTAELQPPYSKTNRNASAYALAALPARYAMERQDWRQAIALKPKMPSSFPWEVAHDPYIAITHFARAIAFSRLGRPDEATQDIEELERLQTSISANNKYWALQIEIQMKAARAWQIYARGDTQGGLTKMHEAAALEASTQKHAITPGAIIPAYELYGDMLIDAGQFQKALDAYQTSWERSPKRYNSLVGQGKAAVGMEDNNAARKYFTQLVDLAGNSAEDRSNMTLARQYLKDLN